MMIPVFVNDRCLTVTAGTTVAAAAAAADPTWRAAIAAGSARLTDGRGLPLDPDAPLTAGSIVRCFLPAQRGAAPSHDADA